MNASLPNGSNEGANSNTVDQALENKARNDTGGKNRNEDRPTDSNVSDAILLALKHKERGNNHFSSKPPNLAEASLSYRNGISLLQPFHQADSENHQINSLLVTLNTNLSTVCYKQQEYNSSKDAADKALAIDASNVKALYRRALAQKELGNLDDALADLSEACKLDVNNKAIRKEIAQLKKSMSLHVKKEKMESCEKEECVERAKNCNEVLDKKKNIHEQCKDSKATDGGVKKNQTEVNARPLPLGHDIPDEELFKRATNHEECPICCLQLHNESDEQMLNYQPCCGKVICIGCMMGVVNANNACPFCRSFTNDGCFIEKLKKRAALGDSRATYNLAIEYIKGRHMKTNNAKAMELLHQAAGDGYATAHALLGHYYSKGEIGNEINKEKANHHFLAGAMGGHNICRHNIGAMDAGNGHGNRAMQHFFVAACDGYEPSLQSLQKACVMGFISKDDYAKALRAYQATTEAIKSESRDKGIRALRRMLSFTDSLKFKPTK